MPKLFYLILKKEALVLVRRGAPYAPAREKGPMRLVAQSLFHTRVWDTVGPLIIESLRAKT